MASGRPDVPPFAMPRPGPFRVMGRRGVRQARRTGFEVRLEPLLASLAGAVRLELRAGAGEPVSRIHFVGPGSRFETMQVQARPSSHPRC